MTVMVAAPSPLRDFRDSGFTRRPSAKDDPVEGMPMKRLISAPIRPSETGPVDPLPTDSCRRSPHAV